MWAPNKTKILRIKNKKKETLTLNVRFTDHVETLLHLRSIVTKEGGTEKKNTNGRISEARSSFIQLFPIRKSKLLSFRTK